jgi:surface antigen
MVHVVVSVLLVCIVVGVLIAVLPVGTDAKEMNAFLPAMHLISSKSNSTVLIAAQAATATAVTVDGYDPGGQQVYTGVQSAPSSLTSSFSASDAGDLSRFFYGQCTYWANMRYRQLTGHWVPWLGNAYQWAYAAPVYGWTISSQPNPNGPSIVVLAPYTQGAGSFGHVAVVENAISSASNGVMTSNWNWLGRWAVQDWVRFYPGPGVSFLWYSDS